MNTDSLIVKKPGAPIRSPGRLRRSSCIMCALAATLFGGTVDYQHLSMSGAATIALDNNPKIRQYHERYLTKQYDDRAAIGNFLPTVTLNAGYTVMNDPLVIDLDPIRSAMIGLQSSTMTKLAIDSLVRANGGALPPALVNAYRQQYGAGATAALDAALPHFIDTLKEQQYPGANISVVQPLFMGGKIIAAKNAAAADKRGAAIELLRIRNEIAQETFNNYCAVALLKKVVEVRQDVLHGMLEHEKDAHGLYEAGLIPRTGCLRAEVAVAEAKRNFADDENRLTLAKLSLRKSMNLSDSVPIDVDDTLSVHALAGTCEEYLAIADSAQPILNYIKTRETAARAKVQAEHSTMLPRVAAYGKCELLPDYLSAMEPEWVAGISCNFDLFTGGKRYMQLASARHLVRETESLMETAHNDIRLWVRKAFIECGNASDRYNKLIVDQSLAEENLRQCSGRFQSGYGTAIEVIDAELALEKNRIEKITALYDFHRSFMDLYTAIGKSEQAIDVLLVAKEIKQ